MYVSCHGAVDFIFTDQDLDNLWPEWHGIVVTAPLQTIMLVDDYES